MRALTPAERAEAGRELDRRTFAVREAEMQASLDQLQAAVITARAELAAYHAAAESTDLEGDVRDALADLAEWETEDRCAPDWLVDVVIGLIAPVKAERDQLTTLVRDMTDPDDCWLDHHGGCQAHGYLSLEPDEKCPHAEAKELLARRNETETGQ